MNKLIEYIFNDGENTTTIDHEKKNISMYERGGWSRSYDLSFKDFLKHAKEWGLKVSLKDSDEIIAKNATNLILAQNAVKHGLDPFRYIPKNKSIISVDDMKTIKEFEKILKKYGASKVVMKLSKRSKENIKNIIVIN